MATVQTQTSSKTPTKAPASNSARLKQVATNLATIRKSNAFLRNAPKLFKQGNLVSSTLMTAQLATQILRDCGIPIPREVTLSIAACQVIASGGAACTAASTGASFGSVAEPTAAAVQAAIAIFQELGITHFDGIQMQQINLGLDVALVVSSGGTNVVADVKLVYDLYMAGETSRYLAQYDADKQVRGALQNFRRYRLQNQAKYAAANFERLQSGDIGMFGFATQIARGSAELFPKFFPEIAAFFPPTAIDVLDVEFHSTDHSIFGLVPSGWGSASGHTEVVMSRTRDQLDMLSKWCSVFLDPCIEGYNRVLGEDIGANTNKLSLTSLCIMSMLPPYFKMVPENFDVRPYLLSWNLTPADFYDDDCITAEIYKKDSKFLVSDFEKKMPSPISFNGVEYVYPELAAKRAILDERIKNKPKLLPANHEGDIDTLLRDPDANKLIKEWGRIVDHGPSKFYRDAKSGEVRRISGGPNKYEPIYPNDKSLLTNQLNLRNSLINGNWRNIQNYFSVLSMIEALSNDWKGYSKNYDQEIYLRAKVDEYKKKRDQASWERADAENLAKGYNAVNVYDSYRVDKNPNDINWLLFAQGQSSGVNEGFWDIITKRKQARERHEVLKVDVEKAQAELDQWIKEAPTREKADAAFASEFKKMVWNKYPQVVASKEMIDAKYREVSAKMVYRGINKMAWANIAKILGVPPHKLVQVNKGDMKPDGPGIFKGI